MVRFFSIALLFLLVACSSVSLELIGDIDDNQHILKSGNLRETLSDKAPKAEYALIIGKDGTAALLSEKSFHQVEIVLEKGNWNSSAPKLPPVCNIKNIDSICIYQPGFSDSEIDSSFSKIISEFQFLGESSKAGHFVRKYKRREN